MPSQIDEDLDARLARFGESIAPFFAGLEQLAKKLLPFFEASVAFALAKQKADLLVSTGWLPHETLPFYFIEQADGDAAKLNKLIDDYYRDNWSFVRAKLEANISEYRIDDESKLIFRQILTAHEHELFSLVPRAMFPEIERVSRTELHNRRLERISSQKALRKLAGELVLSDYDVAGFYAIAVFERFEDHVYADVNEKNLSKFANDPVPNRHAAIHGYFGYNSRQSSLNTILLADYALKLLNAAKMSQP